LNNFIIRLFCACYAFLFFFSALTSEARPITIEDGGYTRSFEMALDEVYLPDRLDRAPEDRVDRLPLPRTTGDAMRLYAAERAADEGQDVQLVLYESGVERNAYTRRILTREVLVTYRPGTDLDTIAATVVVGKPIRVAYAENHAIFRARTFDGALELAETLRAQSGVLSAEPVLAKLRKKRFTPDDDLFPQQWHLRNTGQGGGLSGMDVRVTNVWAQGIDGTGVLIGIIDDGLQYTHQDLAPNYVAAYSRNWNGSPGGTLDPQPDLSYDDHGTPCAGVAAARGDNTEGVAGAAYGASLSGLRLISGSIGDTQESQAIAHSNQHIYVKSNSWGPNDDGRTLEAPGSLTRAALSNSVITGRGGLGTIHVWAGGNGLDANDNANYDGYANSIYTISVAAIEDNGAQAWYSEPGACHIVTAPSSGGSTDIVTTDLLGNNGYNFNGASGELGDNDYTKTFGGTSSSTPLVAGIVALMLEARPSLGWRDVQEILIRSARQINPSDSGWRTNGAGLTFNHKFGSGLVDASAAVAMAQTWTNLPARTAVSSNRTSLAQAIPDNNASGVQTQFQITDNLRIEHVTLRMNISHSRRGHLEVALVSPSGMESVLAERRTDNNAHYSDWTFMTVRHWGESSQGTWTVRVADRTAGTSGTLNSALLTVYGTPLTPLANQPPVLTPISARNIYMSNLLSFTVSASDPVDGDSIQLGASNLPPWAVFATTTGVDNVSQTFSGTPPATGTWTTIFYASDIDGLVSESVLITATDPALEPDYVIDFEGASETKNAYASANVTLSGVLWNMTDALIGTGSNDRKNGARAARIRNTGSMTMLADRANGIGALSLRYAKYGSDGQHLRASRIQPQRRINLDTRWLPIYGGQRHLNAA